MDEFESNDEVIGLNIQINKDETSSECTKKLLLLSCSLFVLSIVIFLYINEVNLVITQPNGSPIKGMYAHIISPNHFLVKILLILFFINLLVIIFISLKNKKKGKINA